MIMDVRMLMLAVARCRTRTERKMWNIEYRRGNVDGKLRMYKKRGACEVGAAADAGSLPGAQPATEESQRELILIFLQI